MPKRVCAISTVSTLILFLLCVSSAVLALRESSICSQVKGMLHLPFDVTVGMVWGLILVGGSVLLLLSKLSVKTDCRKSRTGPVNAYFEPFR
jgi:hypothetical protein